MGETLLTTLKDITGNALRSTQFMRLAVGSVRDAPEAPAAERTFIPALSPEDYNNSVERAIRNGGSLPPGVKMLLEQLRAGMHARFGDAVPANRDLSCLAEGRDVANICNALAKEGKPATAGNLREALAEAVLDKSVSDCICKAASAYLDRLGGGNAMRFASLAKSACPDLVADLRAAKTPEEASAAVARHSKALGRIAQRMAPCCRNEDKFVPLYREALAKELGVHIGSDMVKHAETAHLGLSATSLTDRICGGELDLETDQEIDDAFRKLAADLARERAGLLGQADKLGLSPLAAKTMKRHILSLGKTNKFDFDKFGAAAAKMKPLAEKVDRLLDEGASADDICNAIGDVFPGLQEHGLRPLRKAGAVRRCRRGRFRDLRHPPANPRHGRRAGTHGQASGLLRPRGRQGARLRRPERCRLEGEVVARRLRAGRGIRFPASSGMKLPAPERPVKVPPRGHPALFNKG